ncbi:OpgC family protein [Acidisphaera sp. S103]|uniref:OpgC family protein n=1 Tax=Acidisphaera sp. S103 TaxID=1747223 RepID=UPI00131D1B7D|nr:OpgC domain-containing protein [Acidisphaera sp. S103]
MTLIRRSAVRDLRVDFFRGLALWWIYTDHIPGNVLGDYSLQKFAVCDATEVFVLLAGYGAGLAYGSGLRKNGFVSTAADILRRAWTLYVAHIFLFVLFTAQVTYSATALNRLNYLSESRLDVLGDDPYRSILQAVLLRFQPSLLNILPLYVVLLVFFAVTVWLLRWPRVLFGLSFAIYMVVRFTGLNLNAWTGEGWFFDPYAWQFLFIIGVLLACAPLRPPRHRWPFDVLATGVVVLGTVVTVVIEPRPHVLDWVSGSAVLRYLVIEDKTGLYPFRLISVLALTWLCVRLIRFDQPWLRTRWAGPFVLIGQNSLPVFCSGIVFGFLARLGLEYDDHAFMQVGINLFGALGMVGVGALAAWYRTKGGTKTPRKSATPSAALLPVDAQTDTG